MTVKRVVSPEKFVGAASDTKPTDGATSVRPGATFHAYDTGDLWITYDGTNWVAKKERARGEAGLLSSGVRSADASIKGSPGTVYWLTVSDTAALAIELNDSLDNSAPTDKWGIDLPAAGYGHFILDPPLKFAAGIYLDVSTATCKVTIGYI